MSVESDTTVTVLVTAAGILATICAAVGGWLLRAIGLRVTVIEKDIREITNIKTSPFVLNSTFEKACSRLEESTKEAKEASRNTEKSVNALRASMDAGFSQVTGHINNLKCTDKINEAIKKEELKS